MQPNESCLWNVHCLMPFNRWPRGYPLAQITWDDPFARFSGKRTAGNGPSQVLALADLHPGILLVDHVNSPAAANHAAVFIAQLGRLQAVTYSHDTHFIQGNQGKTEGRWIGAAFADVKQRRRGAGVLVLAWPTAFHAIAYPAMDIRR